MAVIEYLEGSSFLHKLDPRTKVLLSLLFTLVIFIVSRPPAAAALTLSLVVLWFAAKMPLKKIKGYVKFLSAVIILITVLQLLFGPGDHYILKPLIPPGVPLIGGRGSLKWDGLILGIVSGLRLLALVLLLPMLIGTTAPNSLAQGLTRLGLNYKGAFIVTSAINLVPALEEEARVIIEAQKLRGLRAFEEGNILDKLKAYPALAVPLIIAAMRRSQLMSFAMDSRAFSAYPGRTWLEPIKMSGADYRALAVSLIFCTLILVLNFIPL
jgi:energy-coupling factor transport system permease protein